MNRREFLRLSALGMASVWSSSFFTGMAAAQEKNKAKVGVIGAMELEVANLKKTMRLERQVKKAGMTFHEGMIGNTDAVIVQCGMGKVNAGICAQVLIDEYAVTHIINTGVAGSLNPKLNIGDIVVAVDAVQHDFDVTAIGFQKGEIPYTGKSAFAADKELRQRAVQAIQETLPGIAAVEGRICSGDQFIASQKEKDRIVAEYAGDCAEMEGGSVAQVCFLNAVPFVILRAISDKADDSGHMDFAEFAKTASKNSSKLIQFMLEHWQDFAFAD
ncbi:5'-methylthioadenosine/adenosylhomocysteine nucleosidase [Schwartzia sp. (in: firmicutes)]